MPGPWEEYQKKESGPWEEYAGSASPTVSPWESGLRGAGQGLTFGFSDEAIAGLRRLAGGDYEELLKEERLKNELAKQANPLTYKGSELAGAIAPSFTPAGWLGGAGKLVQLSRSAPIWKNALVAAGSGALSGAGYAEGELEDRAKGAVVGGTVSGVLGGVGAGISKGMQKVAPRFAERATGATGKELLNKFDDNAGEELLKRKTIGWLSTPAQIADKAKKELVESSAGIGQGLKNIPAPSKEKLIEKLNIEKLKLDPIEDAVTISKLDKLTKKLPDMDDLGNSQTWWNRKIKADKKVNWETLQKSPQIAQFNAIKSKAYRESVEEAADTASKFSKMFDLGADDLAQKFSSDRKMYSLYKPILEAAERKAAQIQQRDLGGMLDMAAIIGGGGYGVATGDPEKLGYGLGLAALRRGIAPRASSIAARTAYSPVLQNAILRAPVSTYRGIFQGE